MRFRTHLVVVRALTPYLLAPSLPLALAALVRRRWLLAAASATVGAAFVRRSWPLLRPDEQPSPAPGAKPLRILTANLQYSNLRIGDAISTIAARHADVLALIEFTAAHARAFRASSLSTTYPHRIESADPGPGGAALWSRFPLTQIAAPQAEFPTIAAVVDAPTPTTVFAVHPPNPLNSPAALHRWEIEHGRLGSLYRAIDGPVVIIGDFNASFWHPPFRGLLAAGWRDAHNVRGRGFTMSWPTDRFLVPPFVRLDHAIVNEHLVVLDVENFRIAGSDHTGFVVTVAASAPNLPK